MNAAQSAADARRRKAQLAAIHMGAQQLHMDDDVYRAMLERVTGHRSAADLSLQQRLDVLRELARLGSTAWRPDRPGSTGRPENFDRLPPTITKVEALLADMGLAWSYADAIAKRMFGLSRVAWCRRPEQMAAIVAALDAERKKRELVAEVDALLARPGWDEARLRAGLVLPPKWRRHLPTLKKALAFLRAEATL